MRSNTVNDMANPIKTDSDYRDAVEAVNTLMVTVNDTDGDIKSRINAAFTARKLCLYLNEYDTRTEKNDGKEVEFKYGKMKLEKIDAYLCRVLKIAPGPKLDAAQLKHDKEVKVNSDSLLERLPIEIIAKLIEFLTIKDILKISGMSRKLHKLREPGSQHIQMFWKNKLMSHYPEHAQMQANNWFMSFIELYKKQYKVKKKFLGLVSYESKLPERTRDLFTLVRDNNLDYLKNHDITVDDLLIVDKDEKSLAQYAYLSKYQEILNYFYNKIILPDFNSKDRSKAPETPDEKRYDLVYWQVILNQIDAIHQYANDDLCLQRAMLWAVTHGRVEIVDALIEKGISVDARVKDNQTALFLATMNGHAEVVELLLKRGANPNIASPLTPPRQTPLQLAAESGRLDLVILLVETGNANVDLAGYISPAALPRAAANGHFGIATYLIDHDANVNAMHIRIYENIGAGFKDTPHLRTNSLRYAILKDNIDFFNLLLAKDEIRVELNDLILAEELGRREMAKEIEKILLRRYIAENEKPGVPEYRTTFLGMKFGKPRSEKVEAAKKRLAQLEGEDVQLTKKDHESLGQGKLGEIEFKKRYKR